jgi:hypothetical protein
MFFEFQKIVAGRGAVYDVALDVQETEDELMRAIADAIASQTLETVYQKRLGSGWLFKVGSGNFGAGVRKASPGIFEIIVSCSANESPDILMRSVEQIMAVAQQPLCEVEIDPNDYLNCVQVRQGVPTPPPLPADYLTWGYPQG